MEKLHLPVVNEYRLIHIYWFPTNQFSHDTRICKFCDKEIKDEDYYVIQKDYMFQFRSHRRCMSFRRILYYKFQFTVYIRELFPNPHNSRPIKRQL